MKEKIIKILTGYSHKYVNSDVRELASPFFSKVADEIIKATNDSTAIKNLKQVINNHCVDLNNCIVPLTKHGMFATAEEIHKAIFELKEAVRDL